MTMEILQSTFPFIYLLMIQANTIYANKNLYNLEQIVNSELSNVSD